MFIGLEAIIFAGMFLCAAGTIVRGGNLSRQSNIFAVLDFICWLCAFIVLLWATIHGKVQEYSNDVEERR